MGMFTRGATKYGGSIDMSASNSPHVELLRMVGRNKRVLEVGPGMGHVTQRLKQAQCRVTCVEQDREMAEMVRPYCDQIVVGDIECDDMRRQIVAEQFDVITFGDVLEHLQDPASVLGKLRALISPSGYVVASIPNVAHRSLRLSLLFGEFNYGDAGLLDRTHLRFFTLKSIEELMRETGFRIEEIVRILDASLMDGYLRKTSSFARRVLLEVVKMLVRVFVRGEGLTYQFVIKAVPLNGHHNEEVRENKRVAVGGTCCDSTAEA